MKKQLVISKSRYVQSYNCSKKLWLHFNKKNMAAEMSLSEKQNIEEGNEIGRLARKHPMFKGGILVDHKNKNIAAEKTKKAIKNENILFEATFFSENKVAQIDILIRNKRGNFDIIEVKSSSSVKKEHLIDVAFQKKVLREQGLKVDSVYIMHVNSKYVYNTSLDLDKFFTIENVNDKINKYYYEINRKINKHINKLNKKTEPNKTVGSFCKSPHKCPFYKYCHKHLTEDSVLNLSRISKDKKKEFRDLKIKNIEDIPENYSLTDKQLVQRKVAKEKINHIENILIKEFIDEIQYPIYHLDFEATNSSIPYLEGTRPNQFIVYQVSIHKEFKDGTIEHLEYLNTEMKDPRRDIVDFLRKNIKKDGSVLVWNKSFEKTRIKEFTDIFKEDSEFLFSLIDRMIDLAEPFQKMWYYDHKFKGSYSIKNILPVMAPELDYYSLDLINNGSNSQAYYTMLIQGHFGNNKQGMFNRVKKSLLEYCKMDTLAMVKILAKLKKIINNY